MEINEIKEVLNGKPIAINAAYTEWEKKVTRNSVNYTSDNGLTNLYIACEEIAELQQVVIKMIRQKGNIYNLIEEMADVYNGMRFINEICKTNIKIDDRQGPSLEEDKFIKEHANKYTLLEILSGLNEFQNEILKEIKSRNKENKNLEAKGEIVLDMLETLKISYNITIQDIYKLKNFKMQRLSSRMINKEKI